MTVASEINHNQYVGNGVTTSFDYQFRVFKASHLQVQITNLDGVLTTLVLNTDYTVTGVGSVGGKVVLTAPLANGWGITIDRDLPLVQETDLRNQGTFYAETHEDTFDYLTMLIQRVYSLFGLALRRPSWLSKFYDALGNRISNLGTPVKDQDAVTKKYADDQYAVSLSHADDQFRRTLRVPESEIGHLPDVAHRRGSALGFDSAGNPIPLFSNTDTELAAKLASSQGASLIGLERGGKLQDALQYLVPEMFGAFGEWNRKTGTPIVDETEQLKLMFATAKEIGLDVVFRGNKRFLYSSTLSIYPFYYSVLMGQSILVPDYARFAGSVAVDVLGANATENDASVAFCRNDLHLNVWGQYSPAYGKRHARIAPASERSNLDGIRFHGEDAAGVAKQLSFINFRPNVWGFRENVIFSGSHVYGVHIDFPSNRGAWRKGWAWYREEDFGENFQVFKGATAEATNIEGTAQAFYAEKNCNITLGINAHSIDYCDKLGVFNSGSISLNCATFPENGSTNPWFEVNYDADSTGEPTAFYFSEMIANRGNKSPTATGDKYSDPVNGRDCFIKTTGAVIVEINGQLGRYSDTATTLIKSDTTINPNLPLRIVHNGWVVNGQSNGYQGVTFPCRLTSLIYNGQFSTGDISNIWFTTTGTNISDSLSVISDPAVSGSRPNDDIGIRAIQMKSGTDTSNVGYNSHVYFPFPTRPGCNVLIALHYRQLGAFIGYFVVAREIAVIGEAGAETWVSIGETSIYGGSPAVYLTHALSFRVPKGVTKMRIHLRFYYSGGTPTGTINIKDVNSWVM